MDALSECHDNPDQSKGQNFPCRLVTLSVDQLSAHPSYVRLNQQLGGQKKGASDLTEARKVDVRSEIASIASVSTGNLSKAKQVIANGDPMIQNSTKSGEIRVHKAWQLSGLPHSRQREKLEEFRSCKGVGLVSLRLIQKHVARMMPKRLIPRTLRDVLSTLSPNRMAVLDAVVVAEIDAPGRAAYFTKDAIVCLENTGGRECKTAIC